MGLASGGGSANLKIHLGTRQVPIYALVVAKGGPKLDAAKKDSCTAPPDFSKGLPPPLRPDQPPPCGAFSPDGKGGTRTFGQTMAGLSAEFSALLDRRVDDRTGIEGTLDIHLDVDFNSLFTRFDRPLAAGDAPGGPNNSDPFEALGSAVAKLGLRLESARGSEMFIVIDHVERPSEN
ncbi:MAG TPA: TIGR03435 family protein [Bryobacteraceae bacterium]|nr:TIGR03435 family protein [Bryobacteraceae bacterium]